MHTKIPPKSQPLKQPTEGRHSVGDKPAIESAKALKASEAVASEAVASEAVASEAVVSEAVVSEAGVTQPVGDRLEGRPDHAATVGDPQLGGAHGQRDASGSPALRGGQLPTLSAAKLGELADQAYVAMKEHRPFGFGTDSKALLGALSQLSAADAPAFRAVYTQRHGADPRAHLRKERLLPDRPMARAVAYLDGDKALGDAIGLQQAFDAGDAPLSFALLDGRTTGELEALKGAYRAHHGRDLEYDMRGFAADLRGPLDAQGLSLTLRGLKGPDLDRGLALLHGPRVREHAAEIASLLASGAAIEPKGREAIFTMLSTAGGEERTMLAEAFKAETGQDLVSALEPVIEANQAAMEDAPTGSPPDKTVAVVVSSGNWAKQLSGEDRDPIGGYHWREIEAYVAEALERGYTPVIFTPDGLPPSPDALSLLQGTLGPKVGFGLRAGTGPESEQGQAIMEGFAHPRPLSALDPQDFATLHIAGGHGSHHDLVGNPAVERAATSLHEQGKIVTAVCHASPALGGLLECGPATGFSPQLDAVMLKAGYVLDEFNPPYDAHEGLKDLGAKLTIVDRAQALVNIHHTERYERDGRPPVVTGTGPEATDNVARQAFDWLAEQA